MECAGKTQRKYTFSKMKKLDISEVRVDEREVDELLKQKFSFSVEVIFFPKTSLPIALHRRAWVLSFARTHVLLGLSTDTALLKVKFYTGKIRLNAESLRSL